MATKFIGCCLLVLLSCNSTKTSTQSASSKALAKIKFDLSQFDTDGLYGPEDGKRSMDYEFCVSKEAAQLAVVKKIDPSVKMPEGVPGRIRCTKMQQLCIGSTHQKDFKNILIQLAELDFVERIETVYYE